MPSQTASTSDHASFWGQSYPKLTFQLSNQPTFEHPTCRPRWHHNKQGHRNIKCKLIRFYSSKSKHDNESMLQRLPRHLHDSRETESAWLCCSTHCCCPYLQQIPVEDITMYHNIWAEFMHGLVHICSRGLWSNCKMALQAIMELKELLYLVSKRDAASPCKDSPTIQGSSLHHMNVLLLDSVIALNPSAQQQSWYNVHWFMVVVMVVVVQHHMNPSTEDNCCIQHTPKTSFPVSAKWSTTGYTNKDRCLWCSIPWAAF